ncbi:hypothetical protein DLM85_24670 [Hymenobacter edaphi]|uniref:Uncharacterized protein n=1 Tax=Hymenobacter edaphi TaxID=2211146 RepID=A0A328B3P3_9BACT|nr:hypothetical protein DLM85_24670 [Hymenobacter edaphi]
MADRIFRLSNTPLGTVLVKFYQVDPYSDEEFQRVRARDFLQATLPGSGQPWGFALCQGRVAANNVLPEAVARLHAQCPYCTAVRIERAG